VAQGNLQGVVDFLGLQTKATPNPFTSPLGTGRLPGFCHLQMQPV